MSCLVQIGDGAVMLKIVNTDTLEIDRPVLVFTFTAVSIFLWDLSNFVIVWFVTFKYWETARQFARVMRLMGQTAQDRKEA